MDDPARADGRYQHETVEARRVLQTEPHPDAAPHAVAHIREPTDAQRVGHTDHVGRVLLDRVAAVGMSAVARTTRIHHHAAKLAAQLIDDRRPAVMATGVTVVEHDDLT